MRLPFVMTVCLVIESVSAATLLGILVNDFGYEEQIITEEYFSLMLTWSILPVDVRYFKETTKAYKTSFRDSEVW
jgi:hypothetical protein